VKRLIIAAPQGRSGKTTVAVGLCAALAARGLVVQAFKKGPDYIDPSWLTGASGRPCRNLDPYLMGQETVVEAFERGCVGADIAVIEGAMGLYDGLDLEGSGSTAHVARWLQAPILLVVNATRLTRSVAAMVQGYQRFEPETPLAGVILNNVAGERHRTMLTKATQLYCGLPVVGLFPRSEALTIPERHLGLVPRGENEGLVPAIEAARRAVEQHFDLGRILAIAGVGGERGGETRRPSEGETNRQSQVANLKSRIKIGLVRDRAFSFYYPENLEALEAAGAEVVIVDALKDPRLPPVHGLYVGGGFPEAFLKELEANRSLRMEIKAAVEDGLPVYAECGGLMYLARCITWQGQSGEMVGILPCDVEITARPQGHGYVDLEVMGENPLFPTGTILRGHEFHNSRVTRLESPAFAYRVTRGWGLDGRHDGLVYKNVLAAYTHLHALGTPQWAADFVRLARGGS
jgi:cobyrinic acid a,c-diamide synthase